MLETICDILVDAYKRNWITSRDGNISIRHSDRDHFYITPSAVRKQTLQPDQFKKIKVLDNDGVMTWEEMEYTDISKNLRPSGEIPLHFALQKKLGNNGKDTRVVVHLHPTHIVAAMHANIDLSKLVLEFPELGRYTRVARNVGVVPPISEELANETISKLQLTEDGDLGFDIVGIKGHGVVAIDSTPWRAYEHIERLEHICQIVLASKAAYTPCKCGGSKGI